MDVATYNHTFLQSSWSEDAEWWQGATEEDSLTAAVAAAASSGSMGASPPFGGGLLATFLPPPPRPAFLEIPGTSSCDLCGWAWQEGDGDDLQGDLLLILNDEGGAHKPSENIFEDAPHEFGTAMDSTVEGPGTSIGSTEAQTDEANKGCPYSRANAVSFLGQQSPSTMHIAPTGHGVWAWLTARRSALRGNEHSTHVERHHHCTPENHYTLSSSGRVQHAAAAAAPGVSSVVEEALYAELDQREEDTENGSKIPQYEDPSYQNMGYQSSETEADGACRLSASSPPLSSSSAYYSDLSTSANIMSPGWEATYEAVDTDQNLPGDACSAVTVNGDCENELAVIHSEVFNDPSCVGEEACAVRPHPCSLPLTKTVPSDYV